MPLRFFIRTSKVFMRLNVLFKGFQLQKVVTLIFHEAFVPDFMVPVNFKNYKTPADERATAGDSLHVTQKFSLN